MQREFFERVQRKPESIIQSSYLCLPSPLLEKGFTRPKKRRLSLRCFDFCAHRAAVLLVMRPCDKKRLLGLVSLVSQIVTLGCEAKKREGDISMKTLLGFLIAAGARDPFSSIVCVWGGGISLFSMKYMAMYWCPSLYQERLLLRDASVLVCIDTVSSRPEDSMMAQIRWLVCNQSCD